MSSTFPIASGQRRHLLTLAVPGPPVPDGDGGYTDGLQPLTPSTVYAEVRPATVRDLERQTAGTTIATAELIVTMPFHPQVTTQTHLTFKGRTLLVSGVVNPEERDIDTVLFCTEVVP